MSFFSSMIFARQGSPCVVKTSDVRRLIESLNRLGAIQAGLFSGTIRYGDRVDRDNKPTYSLVSVAPGIQKMVDIRWDICRRGLRHIDDVIKLLQPRKRLFRPPVDQTLYRAHIMLGALPPDVISCCNPAIAPGNDGHFTPDSWSLEIGPITTQLLSEADERSIGWIGCKLSGNGYLFPLSEQEFIDRALSHATVRAAAEICQSIWPTSEQNQWKWYVAETG